MKFNKGLSLIQQVAPNFVGVNKQPAKIIGRHMDLGEACVKWILFIMNIIVSVSHFIGAGFIFFPSDLKFHFGTLLSNRDLVVKLQSLQGLDL